MTVQALLFKLANRVDGYTKNGQQFNDASAALTISGATNATPIVITTSTNHGLATGDTVYITGVGGNTNANNTASNYYWTITYASATTFSLDGSSGNSNYTSGGTATPALIGSVPGDRFTAQRLLDVYNEARFILFGAMRTVYPTEELVKLVSGTIVNNTSFQFTSGVATKPTGYISPISLTDSAGVPITILPSSLSIVVGYGNNPDFVESSTNRFVFDENTTLSSLSGTTNIPNASTYKLKYFGLSTFTLSDVLGNSTTESFNDDLHGTLIEIADGIANELGNQAVIELAQRLVGK